ncbi:MAG: HlyD family efflux transporter periplasmic adaptor subunit [bacterium]
MATLESRQARLQGEVRFGPGAVDAWAGFTQELEGALKALEEVDADALLGPARARAELARKRVDALVLQRQGLELKTPQPGRVARLLVRPGAVVQAGQPLVEVVQLEARVIHAWLPEDRSRLLAVGEAVRILPRDRMGELHTGTVERVGPALEALPQRLWFEGGTPRYGRPLLIRTEVGFLAGEAVQVAPK